MSICANQENAPTCLGYSREGLPTNQKLLREITMQFITFTESVCCHSVQPDVWRKTIIIRTIPISNFYTEVDYMQMWALSKVKNVIGLRQNLLEDCLLLQKHLKG